MISVLDTTAFSAAMRNEPEMVRFLSGIKPGNVATVPPVVAEIEYGIRRLDNTSKKYALLAAQKERLLTVIRVLPWDEQSSVNFGSIKADLEKTGTPIDDFDAAIAAIAMSHDAEVLTANLTHFQIIKGLASRHW
ncbi:MAG: type II toxin-antitoxin system VapC family toxin [Spirochaetales bacterium]|nr:MAG: type II toxin-antitoxin system VapC family toxin [Spirochaetales bacterium]